ncbi:MAG: hypothetical protein KF812_09290 [Fimbriimonadaceae bacterium]|nr:hypothetical protein [Fimbriimonadaceae bacterium]
MNWAEQTSAIRSELEREHQQREAALSRCRKVIQSSSRAIRHIHRSEMVEAERLVSEAESLARSIRSELNSSPRILYAGYVHDAEKEWVEATLLHKMVTGSPWPTAQELGVEVVTYLHGACEAASELRRSMLDRMRGDDFETAGKYLQLMEDVYDELITIDFPDGLTAGLRRATDALRAVLERSRSDFTLTALQERLRRQVTDRL